MNEKLKFILEKAITEEEYFNQFYNTLADKASDESIKQALRQVAEQEQLHKEKLESLKVADVVPEKIDGLDIAEDLGLPPIEEFLDIKTMFEFAITQEIAAKLLYKDLAECMTDEQSKQLLLMLSDEEAKHEQILVEKVNMATD